MNLRHAEFERASRWRLPLTRRRALQAGTAGLAGMGAWLLVGCGDDDDSPELDGELEVASLRIAKPPPACMAAQYIAETYLRREGFTDVEYIDMQLLDEIAPGTSGGRVDFSLNFAPYMLATADDAGGQRILAGIHVGCWEVFAADPAIRGMEDLKGRTLGGPAPGPASAIYVFMASFLAHVGIDVVDDVNWKDVSFSDLGAALEAGEIDAFAAFPPMTNAMRDRGTAHVILDGVHDNPYSGFFCCMLGGNSEFISRYPVATKRVLRAYIKGAEHCAREPEAVADFLVSEGGFPSLKPEYAREMMAYLPYDVWRRFDPEDTVRFYALRLHDAGIIARTPEEIIERATDWRFLDELKGELAYRHGGSDRQLSFYCDPETGLPLRTALRPGELGRRTT